MNKKFLIFKGIRRGRKETVGEVTDAAQRLYNDLYGEDTGSFQKNPNIEKTKRPVFSRKYIREALDEKTGRLTCHRQY